MRNLLISLIIAIFTFSFMLSDAQAKRFGGGGSYGVSRQASSFSRLSNPSRMQQPLPTRQPITNNTNKWLGPLAGFAAGSFLTSLLMGHGGGMGMGMGFGLFSWLLIGGLIFFVWRLFTAKLAPAAQPSAQNTSYYQPQPARDPSAPFFSSANYSNNTQTTDLPAGFDEAAFLRQSKATFIRLQAAYDNKNLADIREFTSPEIYAEIQLQIQERGDKPNVTEVISIEAELVNFEIEGQNTIASVQFSGLVREEPGAEPVAIKEVWHFQKNTFMPSWVVAGIQQMN